MPKRSDRLPGRVPSPKRGNVQNRQFWQSADRNMSFFELYYNRLTELAIAMFDWQGLPDTVDPRYLELALFTDGKAVFFKDEVIGHLCLRCMSGGFFDFYNVPTERTAFANNGYTRQLDGTNSVIIWNNFLRTNSMLMVRSYAHRLANLDATIDVNCNAQKTPVMVLCNETERLSLKNMYAKYEGNEPFIFGEKSLDPHSLQALRTDAPYMADKLYTLRTQIWNEALTYLGIANVSFAKRERMIVDEVQRSQAGTIASRYSRLEMRRKACDEINKMFGLDIWVDFRDDNYVPADMLVDETTNEEMENEAQRLGG